MVPTRDLDRVELDRAEAVEHGEDAVRSRRERTGRREEMVDREVAAGDIAGDRSRRGVGGSGVGARCHVEHRNGRSHGLDLHAGDRPTTFARVRRLSSVVVAATLVGSMLQGGIPAARAGRGKTVTYLALGTSLAVGFQPGRGETAKGYVDDLWRSVQQRIPGLTLRNVGCVGETSRSMITGGHSKCHYAAGSQLDAAVAYLEAHPGQVAFITIDVGANDLIERCLPDTWLLDKACAVDMLPRLQTRLTHIVDALDGCGTGRADRRHDLLRPAPRALGLGPGWPPPGASQPAGLDVLNSTLSTAYADAGATVADVATTFRIDDFTDTVVVPGRGPIPVNVALTCRWTWFCSPKFAGDPHTNRTGYRKIARTFDRELQDLLP